MFSVRVCCRCGARGRVGQVRVVLTVELADVRTSLVTCYRVVLSMLYFLVLTVFFLFLLPPPLLKAVWYARSCTKHVLVCVFWRVNYYYYTTVTINTTPLLSKFFFLPRERSQVEGYSRSRHLTFFSRDSRELTAPC